MTRPHIALIADDLIGALDSAAPFALAGYRTLVATTLAHLPAALEGAEVVAVSLGSREIAAGEAAERAGQAARLLAGVPRLFKKIDSRMKGHVAAEVAAILAARGLAEALVCPAIPELGRIVTGGFLRGTGGKVPIEVTLQGMACRCPDAATADDLDRIVAGAGAALLTGARGLAAALARQLPARPVPALPELQLPIALVIGSRDPISPAQVQALRRAAVAWTACPDGACPQVAPSDAMILQATPGPGADGATVAQRMGHGAALTHARTLVLTGGETASAALQAMNAQVLELLGEVATGLPLSRPMGGIPLLVTKSGGFGDADCLLHLLRRTDFIGTRTR